MSHESDILESIEMEIESYEASYGTGDAHTYLERIGELVRSWSEE